MTIYSVFFGFDSGCVEDLLDAALQAFSVDGVTFFIIFFQDDALDAFLERIKACDDPSVVVVL